jgi:hypothetical protein
MGGFGSGRVSLRKRRRVTQFDSLDIRQYRRRWTLVLGEPATAAFSYSIKGGPFMPATIPIVWTANPYGLRPFFQCPRCGRRSCKVYLGAFPACRQCMGLSYPVCYETKLDQAFRKAWKARARLSPPDGLGGIGDWIPDSRKPKGMHWRTFERQRAEADATAAAVYSGIATRLKIPAPG